MWFVCLNFVSVRFIQHNLGGPTTTEFQTLKTEKEELETKYEELQIQHDQICREVTPFSVAFSTYLTLSQEVNLIILFIFFQMEELKLSLQKDTSSEVSAES